MTTKCQGPAPLGVGTRTAKVPAQKMRKAAVGVMCEVKSKQKKAAGQQDGERDDGDDAEGGDDVARARIAAERRAEVGARLTQEGQQVRQLQQEGRHGEQQDGGAIDEALGDDGAQPLGEGHAVVALEGAATSYFANARHHKTRSV